MRRPVFAFGLLTALLVLVLSQAAGARIMKQFRPGDVRACGVHHCVSIRSQRVLDALANFYYGQPAPTSAPAPKKRTPYLRLVYTDGYVTGIAAGSRFTHFLSFGVNTGQFAARTWYTVPKPVAANLLLLASHLSPAPLPKDILTRSTNPGSAAADEARARSPRRGCRASALRRLRRA